MMPPTGCGRGSSPRRPRGPATTCWKGGRANMACPAACMWIGTASIGAKGWRASRSNWPGRSRRRSLAGRWRLWGWKLILANSPQAKGRVERMNGVLQDRLVKEMRLAGINHIESANRFLDGKYLRAFNRQFARAAASPLDVHRAVPRNLNEVLSWEEERVVQGDWTVACEGKRYQLDPQHETLSLVRWKVIVRTLRNGRMQLVYQGQLLQWRLLPKGGVRKQAAAKPARKEQRKPRVKPPAMSHPWRRDGVGLGRKYWSEVRAIGRAARLPGISSSGNRRTRGR